MCMTEAVVEFVLLAGVIVIAGTVLARCADAVAEITGMGRLVVGSVLLAGATSLPELTVDITAIRLNLPDLAVGDLLGSSLMNLLILALLDLTYHSRGKMLSRAAAAHALGGTLSIGLTALAGVGLLTARHAPHWSFAGIHLSVWLLALAYVLGVRMVFLDQRVALQQAKASGAATEQLHPKGRLRKYVIGFAAAAGVILLVGPRLAEAAGKIAELSGLGSSFVGTTFVALSTSLPELVASLAALRIGSFDLAVGNVFGSNAFNMLLFLPLDFAFPGTLFAAASPAHLVSALAAISATAVVIMGQLYQAESRIPLLEPDAWLVIVLIGAALALVYAAGQ
jgi:cation:H+ antiporter